jgi:cytidine deaminase
VSDTDDLRAVAVEASRQAYSPYSGFRVGAALRSAAGAVYRGCNIENASYGLTCCAERAALASAVVAEGVGFRLREVAVVAFDRHGVQHPAPPCGACRQALAEFGADAQVGFQDGQGGWRTARVAELLPHGFTLPDDEARGSP